MTPGEQRESGCREERERATNEAETYLILKTCHLLTDRQASLRALEIISKIFLFSFFLKGI